MNTMRDPAGIPAHPVIFQVLMVATWTLHIAFVHLALGASGLAIYASMKRNEPDWERLALTLTKVAKVGVSLLIVLGVAPLLFTQVIYDPQWYVSNVLSGRWVIAFICTLIIAYCAWFAFYYANHAGAKKHIVVYAWLALVLFCLDGLIMHVLSYQVLLPNQWMNWYAPGGVIDTSGSTLHAIQWPRYLFIMSLSVPAVGVFLIAYTHYFAVRPEYTAEYRAFVRALGQNLAQWGFACAMLPLLIWQFVHPSSSNLVFHPLGWLLVSGLLVMALAMRYLGAVIHGYLPIAGALGLLAVLAIWREVIRINYLKPFGYDITTYTVHEDWPSMLLFFSTFIGVGGLVGGFYLTLLYRCGRTPGLYQADSFITRIGTGAVAILSMWIALFFTYGIAIWVYNNFN